MSCIERSAHIRKNLLPRWLLTFILLLPLRPGDIIAQVASTDRVAIAAAAEGFHRALAQGDRAAALALLAPDAAILESGHLQTRAEYEREHLGDRKRTRLNSSHVAIAYAVFCLKEKLMR